MRTDPVKVYIGIGANQGEREQNLREGIRGIKDLPSTKVTGISSLYCTGPVGYAEQDDFLNAVVQVITGLEPVDLLHGLQQIESEMGRVRTVRWGPRIIDLDIILYGNEEINLPEIQVPHPRLAERAFVLVPLAEFEPNLILSGIVISEKIKQVYSQKIYLFKQNWFATI